MSRAVSTAEAILIGIALHEPLIFHGHPLTCNGGNPDFSAHHDHEVHMLLDGDDLVCPECGRRQRLPPGWNPRTSR